MSTPASSIDVVILCGGKGSRLQSVVADCPKPLARISDKPFLDILIQQFFRAGHPRFILCSGFKGEMIHDHFSAAKLPVELHFSHEESPLGTGGAVKRAESLIRGDSFLVTNGDSYCSVDLGAFYESHIRRDALMSMVLARSDDPEEYGSVQVNDQWQITRFAEKEGFSKRAHVSAGIYLFKKKVLRYIPEGTKYSLEYDLFPHLIRLKHNCYGFDSQTPVIDIGTPRRLAKARQYMDGIETCHFSM
jgi:NDP-sugar pyrophosphorylase family protein